MSDKSPKPKRSGRSGHQDASVTSWVAQYQELRPAYERFINKLTPLLHDLLRQTDVKVHTIESRVKAVESFTEKIQRSGKNYKNPLKEVTDFAGIRIILYYEDDVDRVAEMIEREFRIDNKRSVDKRASLRDDQFGYLSVHKIVQCSATRAPLAEWREFSNLFAEVQIRSVLQHSWAAIQHSLEYKTEADVPREFRRRLVRLAGLLELADEEFASLRKAQRVLSKSIATDVVKGHLGIPVDALSLREFLPRSTAAAQIVATVTRCGMRRAESKVDVMGVSQLVQVCKLYNINTIAELEDRLKAISLSRVKAVFDRFFAPKNSREPQVPSHGTDAHILAATLVAVLAEKSAKEVTETIGWGSFYSVNLLHASRAPSARRRVKRSTQA